MQLKIIYFISINFWEHLDTIKVEDFEMSHAFMLSGIFLCYFHTEKRWKEDNTICTIIASEYYSKIIAV